MSMRSYRRELKKASKSQKIIGREVVSRVVGYVTAAFGLVAGLAWDDAIKSLLAYLFPLDQNTIIAKFVYAGVMTILLVLVSIYLIKIFRLAEEKRQKEAVKEVAKEVAKIEEDKKGKKMKKSQKKK